jgi:rSAM/selenodomain-associated transferase 1
MQFPDARLLIFAKAPRPGTVKTRLIPRLGAEGACAVYRQLLTRLVRLLAGARVSRLECWCAPDADDALFAAFRDQLGVTLHVQQGKDLGERMQHAARQALERAAAVLLVGVDCPVLRPAHLIRALIWLEQGADAVLAPAEDGGYVLLGLRRADRALFEDVPWGTGRVLEVTRERLRGLGWRWSELETLWDLDQPRDLDRLLHADVWRLALQDQFQHCLGAEIRQHQHHEAAQGPSNGGATAPAEAEPSPQQGPEHDP